MSLALLVFWCHRCNLPRRDALEYLRSAPSIAADQNVLEPNLIAELTKRKRWRLALVSLLIFSFVASVLGDAHAQADHANNAPDVSVVHIADFGGEVEHLAQPDHDKAQGQEWLDDLTHGCFVFLAPSEACHLPFSFNNGVWGATKQHWLHRDVPRLDRPPKYIS